MRSFICFCVVCKQLGFRFAAMPHDAANSIAKLVQQHQIKLALISGARILKSDVIACFADGIVNFHPGKLPETSGLDAFFYTLKNGVDAGVTTHFIDARVDAGMQIAFDPVLVAADDTPEDILANGYNLQLSALRRFLAMQQEGSLRTSPVVRASINDPMESAEKWRVLQDFPNWRAARVIDQAAKRLFELCKVGDDDAALAVLAQFTSLLEHKTKEGWTPLIVACFNQHAFLAKALLRIGANPNAMGNKGTNVLMYAKTSLMQDTSPDTYLLDTLITAGADPAQCDIYGRSIHHYVKDHPALAAYFARKDG